MIAPRGVEALNAMRCFLHSERESVVERSEVVSARAVGAVMQSCQVGNE